MGNLEIPTLLKITCTAIGGAVLFLLICWAVLEVVTRAAVAETKVQLYALHCYAGNEIIYKNYTITGWRYSYGVLTWIEEGGKRIATDGAACVATPYN